MSLASLSRRLAALLYENILLAALLLVAGFVAAPATQHGPGTGGAGLNIPPLPARVAIFYTVFGVGALYFGWSWTGGRRTLAMKTWRIHLALRDRSIPGVQPALIRYAAGWIGPALAILGYLALRPSGHAGYALPLLATGYAWALVDPERQFLHDRIAGTRIFADPPRALR